MGVIRRIMGSDVDGILGLTRVGRRRFKLGDAFDRRAGVNCESSQEIQVGSEDQKSCQECYAGGGDAVGRAEARRVKVGSRRESGAKPQLLSHQSGPDGAQTETQFIFRHPRPYTVQRQYR